MSFQYSFDYEPDIYSKGSHRLSAFQANMESRTYTYQQIASAISPPKNYQHSDANVTKPI